LCIVTGNDHIISDKMFLNPMYFLKCGRNDHEINGTKDIIPLWFVYVHHRALFVDKLNKQVSLFSTVREPMVKGTLVINEHLMGYFSGNVLASVCICTWKWSI